MRTAALGWFLCAILAQAEPLTCFEVKASEAQLPLPTAIRLRVERNKLTSPESKAAIRARGLPLSDDDSFGPGDSIRITRVSDGTVYLVDNGLMALWILDEGRWNVLLEGVYVNKTFGGAPPSLPIRYVGNKRFLVTETVAGEVKELSPEKPHLPQALAVTFLIDSKEGRVIARGPAFRYSQNPPVKVPEDWKEKFGLLEVKWLESDGR